MRFNCNTFYEPMCVSSSGCCRWSGHELLQSPLTSFYIGNIIGFISIPIISLILLGYLVKVTRE